MQFQRDKVWNYYFLCVSAEVARIFGGKTFWFVLSFKDKEENEGRHKEENENIFIILLILL